MGDNLSSTLVTNDAERGCQKMGTVVLKRPISTAHGWAPIRNECGDRNFSSRPNLGILVFLVRDQ